MSKGFAGFVSMRTRLQRISDARFFSGWVVEFEEHEVRLKLNTQSECQPNEVFLIEVFGRDSVASFKALLTLVYDSQAHFTILTPISTRTANENARVSVNGIYGTITHGDVEVDVRVVDISAGGIGLIVREPIQKGETIYYNFTTPVGDVTGSGQVRYCRVDGVGTGAYRLGVRLADQGRIEQARWARLLRKDAA